MKPVLLTMTLCLTLAGCFPANKGYGNHGAGNRGWDRFHQTVEQPAPGVNQLAETR